MRTATTDLGVTPGGDTSSFVMHGVPVGAVVFSGAAYPDRCAFVFNGGQGVASWISEDVTVTISPGGSPANVALRFHGVGNATVGIDFDADTYIATTLAGNGIQGHADGFGSAAQFEGPNGIALEGDNLYIADRNIDQNTSAIVGMTIRRLTLSTGQVTTLAGDPQAVGTTDGDGSLARFALLRGLAVTNGLIYVLDRCALRTVSTAPPFRVTTLIGTRDSFNPDRWQCFLTFGAIFDIAIRPSGIYVVDAFRFTVNRIDLSTSPPTVTTVAGTTDVSGSDDGPIGTAHFFSPNALIFPYATDDVFYVADSGVTPDFQFYGLIRQVSNFTGEVRTVAGAAHSDGMVRDGLGTGALFNVPRRFATDGNNLFIGDEPAVRRMDLASFAVTTIAGGNTSGLADGPAGSSLLSAAFGLARGPGGKILFSDQANFVIRVLAP